MALLIGNGQIVNVFNHTRTIGTVTIPACPQGFLMGSDAAGFAMRPIHRVVISRNFRMGKTPVTNGQFDSLVGFLGANRFVMTAPDPRSGYHHVVGLGDSENGFKRLSSKRVLGTLEKKLGISINGNDQDLIQKMGGFQVFEMTRTRYKKPFEGYNNPVVGVSWFVGVAFAELWGLSIGETGWRLPTEAEWEYAARGRNHAEYGDETERWFDSDVYHSYGSATRKVGKRPANSFGLYDMMGNVLEWTASRYGPYSSDPTLDPWGPTTAAERVMRGSFSWVNTGFLPFHGATDRCSSRPNEGFINVGFRIAIPDSPGR